MAASDLGLVGIGLLVAGLLLVAGGLPTYTTEVAATAPDVEGLTEQTERSPAVNVDPLPFSSLSPAERDAVSDARDSPGEPARGPSGVGAGSTSEYRNDVTNAYVVSAGDEVHLVRIVTEIGYVQIALGFAAVVPGGLLLVFAGWHHRSS